MRVAVPLAMLVACGIDAPPSTSPPIELPDHNACLAEGEVMSDEVCRAVVEEDGRQPTRSANASGIAPNPNDPRLTDPDYQWLTAEVERCTCVCCHTGSIGGPGVHRFDIEHAPVWIDSADGWALSVFAGETDDFTQTLPTTDPERLQRVIERERERRGY